MHRRCTGALKRRYSLMHLRHPDRQPVPNAETLWLGDLAAAHADADIKDKLKWYDKRVEIQVLVRADKLARRRRRPWAVKCPI
jgi:hypothetical protein